MKRVWFCMLTVCLVFLAACSVSSDPAVEKQELIPPLVSDESYNMAGAAGANVQGSAPAELCSGASDADTAAFAAEVIDLVNLERENAGLWPLESNALLAQAAQGHTIDMACNFFLSHTGSDGSSPYDRIAAEGYLYSFAGENVARGYSNPASVVTAWMNSQLHRDAILNEWFAEVGVGYIYNAEDTSGYRHYWTMNFGTP